MSADGRDVAGGAVRGGGAPPRCTGDVLDGSGGGTTAFPACAYDVAFHDGYAPPFRFSVAADGTPEGATARPLVPAAVGAESLAAVAASATDAGAASSAPRRRPPTRWVAVAPPDAACGAPAAAAPDTPTEELGGALLAAARAGDAPRLLDCLAAGAPAAAADAAGRTAVHYAAAGGLAACVAALLDAGADADARDGRGRSPLHVAAARGAVGSVGVLVGRGAGGGRRSFAARSGDRGRAVRAGAETQDAPRRADADAPAGCRAARTAAAARLPPPPPAAVDAVDEDGVTPLAVAAAAGWPDVVDALLLAGAGVRAGAPPRGAGGALDVAAAAASAADHRARRWLWLAGGANRAAHRAWRVWYTLRVADAAGGGVPPPSALSTEERGGGGGECRRASGDGRAAPAD